MGRFEGQPTPPAGDAAAGIEHANDEITRLRARIAALEQTLETETRIRLEAGALLASERMRTRELQEQLATASGQPIATEPAPEGNPRRWWQRPDPS